MTDEQKKLHKLALCPHFQIATEALCNKKLHPYTLDVISKNDNFPTGQELAASHPNISNETLKRLSEHPNSLVRSAVFRNENLPQEILDNMSNDSLDTIRMGVARHRKTSKETLEKLMRDKVKKVRIFAEKT